MVLHTIEVLNYSFAGKSAGKRRTMSNSFYYGDITGFMGLALCEKNSLLLIA